MQLGFRKDFRILRASSKTVYLLEVEFQIVWLYEWSNT